MRSMIFICTALVALAPGAASAQEFQKDGLPCIAEICLGDGIAELSSIQWERSRNRASDPKRPQYTSTQTVSALKLEMLEARFRGDLSQSSPYLAAGAFDSDVLPALAKVTAACSKHQLTGRFTTASGNPTTVAISLTPGHDGTSTQRWTVVSIVRTFPGAVTKEQQAAVEAQLSERYHAFGAGNMRIKNPKPGEGRVNVARANGIIAHFRLYPGTDESNRMKQHAACGGTSAVAID